RWPFLRLDITSKILAARKRSWRNTPSGFGTSGKATWTPRPTKRLKRRRNFSTRSISIRNCRLIPMITKEPPKPLPSDLKSADGPDWVSIEISDPTKWKELLSSRISRNQDRITGNLLKTLLLL